MKRPSSECSINFEIPSTPLQLAHIINIYEWEYIPWWLQRMRHTMTAHLSQMASVLSRRTHAMSSFADHFSFPRIRPEAY